MRLALAVLGGVALLCAFAACAGLPQVQPPAVPVPEADAAAAPEAEAAAVASLRPPEAHSFRPAAQPSLPEPPPPQPAVPSAVTLSGASANPAIEPRLPEPGVPAPSPAAQGQRDPLDRVAGERAAPVKPAAKAGPAAVPAARPASPMPAPRGAAGVRPAEAASPRTDVLARVGDPIEVGFDGRGWLYLGCGEEQGGAGEGLVFHGGTTSGGRSLFSFGALERGVYDLRFQLQDNVNGGLREETVRVSVLSEGEFAERLASAPAAETPSAGAGRSVGDPRRSAAAERYFSLGEYDRAIPEFLAVYEEGGPHLDERLADSYAATGDYPAAARYYVRNLSASEPYASRAAAGLARAAATTGDAALLLEQFPGVQGPEPMPVGEALLAVGRSQAEAGRPAVAVAVLREYLRGDFSGGRLDEACFLLAQLLEADTPLRDLRQARDLYHRVWDEFPESPLAAPAKARRDYLNRHFFLVR